MEIFQVNLNKNFNYVNLTYLQFIQIEISLKILKFQLFQGGKRAPLLFHYLYSPSFSFPFFPYIT